MVGLKDEAGRNIFSLSLYPRDKLTNTDCFINWSALDNRVSLFRVHFTESYSRIYCGHRSEQAFHRRTVRSALLFPGVASHTINQIFLNGPKVSRVDDNNGKTKEKKIQRTKRERARHRFLLCKSQDGRSVIIPSLGDRHIGQRVSRVAFCKILQNVKNRIKVTTGANLSAFHLHRQNSIDITRCDKYEKDFCVYALRNTKCLSRRARVGDAVRLFRIFTRTYPSKNVESHR